MDLDPTTGINDQTELGTITDGSVSGDTIMIRLSRGLLTQPVTIGGAAQPAPVQGDLFTNVKGETRLLIGGGGTGLITVIDDSTPSEYTVRTNEACAPNPRPWRDLAATPQSGFAPLEVDFNGSASSDPDAGDTIAEYTFDFGDGSAPVTQSSPDDQPHLHGGRQLPGHADGEGLARQGEHQRAPAWSSRSCPEGDYYTVTPCRLLDTRTQDGGAPVQSGTDRVLDVDRGHACGVSPLATAVAINVTITQPTGQGYLTVYPADLAQPPATSTLNFLAGMTRANNALPSCRATAGSSSARSLAGAGTTHVIVDVVGFFIAETP